MKQSFLVNRWLDTIDIQKKTSLNISGQNRVPLLLNVHPLVYSFMNKPMFAMVYSYLTLQNICLDGSKRH